MIVADTSGLLAFFNASDAHHRAAIDAIAGERDPLVVSPYVLAELDYLVATQAGVDAELALLAEFRAGGYNLVSFDSPDVAKAVTVIERYRDQDIGLADASLVVLAARFETRTLLTLDHRHFDVVRPLSGGQFRLVP